MEAAITDDKLEFARKFGYLTKGVVYALIGGMTALWAFDMGGEKGDKSAVKDFLSNQPMGKVLLGAVALGLTLYALYRFAVALVGTQENEDDKKEAAKRVGAFFSGLGYLAVAVAFGREIVNPASSSDSGSRKRIVEWLLDLPMGAWIVGAIGLIFIGIGLYHGYKALSGKFLKKLQRRLSTHGRDNLLRWAGMVGYLARAVVFILIGGFLVATGVENNASQAKGTKGVFNYLEDLPYGKYILGGVALGLLAYGIFMFVVAIYGRKAKT